MTKLPSAPPPDWRQYVVRMGIWIAFVGALGYAAANGGLAFLGNDIDLKMEPNRASVALASKEPAVIQVKVTLRNNTGETVVLSAPSACKVFRWQIFDVNGSQVQARYDPVGCPEVAVQAGLKSGAMLEEFYAIPLEVSRFDAGQKYVVHARYWGHESEFEFSTEP